MDVDDEKDSAAAAPRMMMVVDENIPPTLKNRKRKRAKKVSKKVQFNMATPEVRIFDRSFSRSPSPKNSFRLSSNSKTHKLSRSLSAERLPQQRSSFSLSTLKAALPSPPSQSSYAQRPLPQCSTFTSALSKERQMRDAKRPRLSGSIGGFGSSLQHSQMPSTSTQQYRQRSMYSHSSQQSTRLNNNNQYHPASTSSNSRLNSLQPRSIDGQMINSSIVYYPVTPIRLRRSSSFRSPSYYKPS